MNGSDPQQLFNQAVAAHRQGRAADAERLYAQILLLLPDHPQLLFNHGSVLKDLSRPADALDRFDSALSIQPDFAPALISRGNILRQLKRFDEALASFDRARALMPAEIGILLNRGQLLCDMQRHEEALASYDAALALNPRHAGVLNDRGLALAAMRRPGEALASYDAALAAGPGHAGVLNNRGLILSQMGRFAEALASFDAALAINSGDIGAYNNRGLTLSRMGRFEDALANFDAALGLQPDNWGAHNNRGLALSALQRPDAALASYDAALALSPGNADALNNRGVALIGMGRFEEALASIAAVLALNPADAGALNNRGLALSQMARPDDALASFEAALAIKPDYVDALNNRGRQLLLLGRFAESLASYEKARALNPGDSQAQGGVAELALRMCDWPLVAEISGAVKTEIMAGRSGISPFLLLGYSDDAQLQLQCARNHIAVTNPVLPRPLWNGAPYRNARIKLSYLSSDFQEHPVAHLAAELFERHDRTRFEVTALSFGRDDGGTMRTRLVKAFDHFVDVRGKSDSEVADYLSANRVDIAIDMVGHTQNERLGILSHRPAPVQVSYLGYPGTLGADFVDYVIADAIVAPFDQQPYYAEQIVHLPDSYQANDSRRAIAAATPSRAAAGLPAQGFVFCCFNNNWKITAPLFEIWMRLLQAVPGSVLWLLDAGINERLRGQAAARGVDPARLIFAPRSNLQDHLARHRLADLFLDTLPYNGHTTASDALWAGLPLVTCQGASFAARVATSLLNAAGFPELVTKTLEDYEILVLRLARDTGLLQSIRSRLEQNRLTCALFDADRFRRNIEAAYTRMLEIAERGGKPQSFSVAPGP